jgi:hypothetical protein
VLHPRGGLTQAKAAKILVLENARWIVHGTFGADEQIRAVPFDTVEIELADIWGAGPGRGEWTTRRVTPRTAARRSCDPAR